MPRSNGRKSVYIVGTGAVGGGMALALPHAGVRVCGMWNRSTDQARVVEELTGTPVDVGAFGPSLGSASLILLCVADDAIPAIAKEVSKHRLASGAIIAHTSGCLNHEVMTKTSGHPRGSLHPLVACPDAQRAAEALIGATFVVEGDYPAVEALQDIAIALRGQARLVASNEKARYHAGAVLASNLVVALLDEAIREAAAAGLEGSREALVDLAVGALQRVRELGPVGALTGPVSRGDASSVSRHLTSLSGRTRDIYRLLSREALRMARERGLDEALAAELDRLLQ